MKGQPTPWRASKASDGTWRVIRTTWLGYATRVEVCIQGITQSDAHDFAQRENSAR